MAFNLRDFLYNIPIAGSSMREDDMLRAAQELELAKRQAKLAQIYSPQPQFVITQDAYGNPIRVDKRTGEAEPVVGEGVMRYNSGPISGNLTQMLYGPGQTTRNDYAVDEASLPPPSGYNPYYDVKEPQIASTDYGGEVVLKSPLSAGNTTSPKIGGRTQEQIQATIDRLNEALYSLPPNSGSRATAIQNAISQLQNDRGKLQDIQKKTQESSIPGLKIIGNVAPDSTATTAARKSIALAKNLDFALNKIGDMMRETGPTVNPASQEYKRYQSQFEVVLNTMRDLANAGVLNPGELPFIERSYGAFDPLKLSNNFTSTDELMKSFYEFKELVGTRFLNSLESNGYTTTQPLFGVTGNKTAQPTGKRVRIGSDGKVVR